MENDDLYWIPSIIYGRNSKTISKKNIFLAITLFQVHLMLQKPQYKNKRAPLPLSIPTKVCIHMLKLANNIW